MKLKKLILPVMIFLMLMPIMVNAEVCNSDKITIDSVTIKEKSNNVTEVEQPVIEGKKIKVNLKMMEVNDSIEYKMLIKNDSNEDYEYKNSFNVNSNYIEYTLKANDDSLIVKAGKTKEVFLKVQYKNEVPDASFDDGKFNDNKSFVLNLSNGQTIEVPDTTKNPKTGDSLIMIMLICILCVGITMYVILSKKKINKFMVLLLTIMITVPASVYALCKIEIAIESNVVIEKDVKQKYEVGYLLNVGEVLYTDAEASKYTQTVNTNCNIVYIGSTKYNYCSNLIQKDTTTYEAGSTVNLKAIKIKYLAFDYTTCELQSDNSYLCPSGGVIEEFTITNWDYDNLWNMYGYTYSDDDKDVMNFGEYRFDYWTSDRCFGVTAPTTFKMPAHSVLFVRRQPE